MRRARQQYNNIALAYQTAQKACYAKKSDESRTLLYGLLKKVSGRKMLDIGCGFGTDAAFFHKKGAEVWGVDSSTQMIGTAQKLHPQLSHLLVKNFSRTGFRTNYFDYVISRYAIQHATNITPVMKEIYRVLKPRGSAVIIIGHPFMQYSFKKRKNYFQPEIVSIPLYHKKVIVQEPAHTLSDYLSPFVLKHFTLTSVAEGPKKEHGEIFSSKQMPEFFLFVMKKK